MSEQVSLSEQTENRLKALLGCYPQRKSVTLPALHLAQQELGWVSDKAVKWVSERLEIPLKHVIEVATFYTMYYKKPVGKYHVQVCRTLSCMLCGAKDVTAFLKKRFGLKAGEVSQDGMWSFEEVECLGSCGTAPMVQINDVFFEKLSIDSLEAILKRVEQEQPDLRYSTIREELGTGLSDMPRSQAWGA